MSDIHIISLIAVYFGIGVLYSGDEWYPGTFANLYLDNRPIWPEFYLKTLFWPMYWLGWIGILIICLIGLIYIKILEARECLSSN